MQKSATANCGCPQLPSIACSIGLLQTMGAGLTGLWLILECPFWFIFDQFINLQCLIDIGDMAYCGF